MRRVPIGVSAAVVLLGVITGSAQVASPRPPTPGEPTSQIVAAFRTHRVVAISDPHGVAEVQAFILALIRDARFREVVDDIVLETANARYQDVLDRFVRGESVPLAAVQRAWQDHTVANSLGEQARELIEAVRAANAASSGRKLRLVAGDPPIDWEHITSREDHGVWSAQRDTYPAAVIRRQVLDRGRRALVVYGQGHLQRRQVASNYDMSAWQAHTITYLVERDAGTPVFNIWTWLDREVDVKEAASWPVPSLAVLKGTTLGARDFGTYARGLLGGNRFAVQPDGTIVPLARDQWREIRMDEQFDALLYLGAPSGLTFTDLPSPICRDPQSVTERVRRLTLASPPVELANFKKACGL